MHASKLASRHVHVCRIDVARTRLVFQTRLPCQDLLVTGFHWPAERRVCVQRECEFVSLCINDVAVVLVKCELQ